MKRIINAFLFSLDGLTATWHDEAAFRNLVVLALAGIFAALFLPLSILAKVLLVFFHVQTLVIELLNTAVEAAIDRIGEERHALSKKAKDCGSAAQFVMLIALGGLWLSALLGLI